MKILKQSSLLYTAIWQQCSTGGMLFPHVQHYIQMGVFIPTLNSLKIEKAVSSVITFSQLFSNNANQERCFFLMYSITAKWV